jgi:putative transposase
MSRKYKFYNKEGLYFVSFATVYWIDIFIRENYCSIIIDALKFYIQDRLELFAYCIMPSHIHLIFRDKQNEPEKLLGNIKRYTSNKIQEAIDNNPEESRKGWLIWMMKRAASKTSNVNKRMLWQHHNKPIELWSQEVINQKLNYIHQNPVEAGFVTETEHWKYSSANNYAGGKGMMDITLL